MPELPEVETISRELELTLKGKTIKDVDILYPKVVRGMKPEEFIIGARGAKILSTGRRAKLVLINLSNGNTIIIHLKLSGRLLFKKDTDKPHSLTEVIFDIAGLSRLFYDDLRRFGYMRIVKTDELERYFVSEGFGPEVIEKNFDIKKFKFLLELRPRAKIKPLLMDQKFIAGVGNIYASEACFCAKIMPTRQVMTLKEKEIDSLYDCLKKILQEAIRYKGSSVDDYLDIYGKQGGFVPRLKVYGREGEPCLRCGAKLKKITLASRGTVFCPKCQK